MRTILILSFILQCSSMAAQQESKFSFEVNYGLNGNFFVRNYYEDFFPFQEILFLKKNFLGTTGGLEFKYKSGQNSRIGIAYTRSTNKGKKDFIGNIDGVDISIENFQLRSNHDFYQFFYERDLSKKNTWIDYQVGLFVMNGFYQELSLAAGNLTGNGFVQIRERDFKHYGMQEGGVFTGIHLNRQIDTHFRIGVKFKAYYLLSAPGLEEISITPTLAYNFSRK